MSKFLTYGIDVILTESNNIGLDFKSIYYSFRDGYSFEIT